MNHRMMQSDAIAAQVLHDYIHALCFVKTFGHFSLRVCRVGQVGYLEWSW